MSIKAEDFVRAWESSKSLVEVAEKLGMTPNSAWQRAKRYRDRGVKLQEFKRRGRGPMNYAALNAVVKQIRKSTRGRPLKANAMNDE